MKELAFVWLVLSAIPGPAMAQERPSSSQASPASSELADELARQKRSCEDELQTAADVVLAAFDAEAKRIQGMRWLPVEERVRRFHLLCADRIAFLADGVSPTVAAARRAYAAFEAKANVIRRRWVGFVDARLAAVNPTNRELSEALKIERASRLQWTSSRSDSSQRVVESPTAPDPWVTAIDAMEEWAATGKVVMARITTETGRLDQAIAQADQELLGAVTKAVGSEGDSNPQPAKRIAWEWRQARWSFTSEDIAAQSTQRYATEYRNAIGKAFARFEAAMAAIADEASQSSLALSSCALWQRNKKVGAILEDLSRGMVSRASVGLGKWSVVGDELLQADIMPKVMVLSFGSPEWSDYDYEVEVRRDEGNNGLKVCYHVLNAGTFCAFQLGCFDNKYTEVECFTKGEWGRLSLRDNQKAVFQHQIEGGRWYRIMISVRGAHVRCSCDGKEFFEVTDPRFSCGRVGLGSWGTAARFRNIRITTPQGALLWEGLPLLPQ